MYLSIGNLVYSGFGVGRQSIVFLFESSEEQGRGLKLGQEC